jgi:hypothetical protein
MRAVLVAHENHGAWNTFVGKHGGIASGTAGEFAAEPHARQRPVQVTLRESAHAGEDGKTTTVRASRQQKLWAADCCRCETTSKRRPNPERQTVSRVTGMAEVEAFRG